jgi:hypothetical protein
MAELDGIARIRLAAEGQRRFARRVTGQVRAKLEETAITLDMAADIAEGRDDALLVLLPQEMWSDRMYNTLVDPDG